jgi:hypothetical protein
MTTEATDITERLHAEIERTPERLPASTASACPCLPRGRAGCQGWADPPGRYPVGSNPPSARRTHRFIVDPCHRRGLPVCRQGPHRALRNALGHGGGATPGSGALPGGIRAAAAGFTLAASLARTLAI